MGTNYYFVPKKLNYDNFTKIKEIYKKDVDESVRLYIKDTNEEYNRIIDKEIKHLFQGGLKDVDDWYTQPYLETIDWPEIHICKLSAGWIPLLQSTKHYSDIEQLKYFYETYKDYIKVEDEYREEIDFYKLLKNIEERTNNKSNQSHLNSDYYFYDIKPYLKDKFGFEWSNIDFS